MSLQYLNSTNTKTPHPAESLLVPPPISNHLVFNTLRIQPTITQIF